MSNPLPSEIREALDAVAEDAAEDGADVRHYMTPSALRDIRAIAASVAKMKMEALRLFEPTPKQTEYLSCEAKEVLFSKGNRTGGSIAGFVEVARAVTGQDPYDKYPKRDGTCLCIGWGEGHIGRVIHRYLFRWNAFKIIRDKETQEWRSYRPWPASRVTFGKEGDLERMDESRPAPPLIPERFLREDLAWSKKRMWIFTLAKFTTGWDLYAMNSQGQSEHAQGFPVDLVHIDEDLASSGWAVEMNMRLADRRGKLRWTAMPHGRQDDIITLLDRGEEEAGKENPQTVVIYAHLDDNPFLEDDIREEMKRIARSEGEQVYAQRIEGRLPTTGSRLMYPAFNILTHNAIQDSIKEDPERKDQFHKIQQFLTATGTDPPQDWFRKWTGYAWVDPGTTVAAALFFKVPPPEFGDFKVAVGEVYIRDCRGMVQFAREFQKKFLMYQPFFEFGLDFKGAHLRDIGGGKLPIDLLQDEFAKLGMESIRSGARFTPGSTDIESRVAMVRHWLYPRDSGTESGFPTLLICTDKCPNLVRELLKFKKKVLRQGEHDIILEEGNRKRDTHLIECAEMSAAHGMPYIAPKMKRAKNDVETFFEMMDSYFKDLRQQNGEGSAQPAGVILGARGS